MSTTRIWIMDGHNMIFAIGPLQRLQISGRRDEARAGLVEALLRFARARGEEVLVVFDGNDAPRNTDVIDEPLLKTVYALRQDNEADDRILYEARTRFEQGGRVTVVTNDRRTLAWDLPGGVQHLEVLEFWQKYIEPVVRPPGKRVEGDFSDVENEMMARAALAEPGPQGRGSVGSYQAGSSRPAVRGAPRGGAGKTASPLSGSALHASEAARNDRDERIRKKKERGRRRQERRLARHRKGEHTP